MKIPDFAVSSQEAGFDEFLKVYSEYFNYHFEGCNLFYGMKNNDAQDHDKLWTTNIIKPQEAIALLTGKQLTEGERCWCLKCSPNKLPNLRFNVCGICGNKRCPHAEDHNFKCTNSNDVDQVGELLPTQESVKDGSLGIVFTEQAENAFNHYEYPSLINTLDTSAAFWIGWRQAEIFFSTQQTAHLQQQLKEAKELLNNTDDLLTRLEDYTHGKDGESITELRASINKFLTRNK